MELLKRALSLLVIYRLICFVSVIKDDGKLIGTRSTL